MVNGQNVGHGSFNVFEGVHQGEVWRREGHTLQFTQLQAHTSHLVWYDQCHSLHDSSKGPQLVVLLLILLALRPTLPFIVWHLSSRFRTSDSRAIPGLFIPQSFDALAHEFNLAECSHLAFIFHRSFLPANSSLICLICCLIHLPVYCSMAHCPFR